jgi:hypothetical protein
MSSNASKPSHSHYRPWFQNQADNAVSHITSQDAAAAESITDDDNVSMTYLEDTEPVDYADDEYDQSEEEEEQEDEERPDRPDEHYPGAPSGFHTSHHVYTGSYHHGFDLSAAVQPPSIYDLDESDASDEVVGHVLPVDYTAIADIITDDIDMDESFDTAGNFAPFNDGAVNYHQYPPQQDIDGILFSANPATSQWDVPGDVPPPEVESITSDNVDEVQQQLNQLGPGDEFEDGSTVWFPIPPPPPHAFISPNMSNLNPGNYPLVEFLQHWSFAGGSPKPRANRVTDLAGAQVTHVQYGDLAGDQCDMQGIDWEDLGVTRKDARERRLLTYRNYTNQQGSDRWHVSSTRVAVLVCSPPGCHADKCYSPRQRTIYRVRTASSDSGAWISGATSTFRTSSSAMWSQPHQGRNCSTLALVLSTDSILSQGRGDQ